MSMLMPNRLSAPKAIQDPPEDHPMSIFARAGSLLRQLGEKAVAVTLLAAATLLPATHSSPAQALAGAPFEGRFTMKAEHVCPANRVVYDMELHVSDAGLADLQARFPLNIIAFRLENILPDGLKWESFTTSGDGVAVGDVGISSLVRDNDRLLIDKLGIHSGDVDGDGAVNTVRIKAVAEVLPGVPLPRTFSHTATLKVLGLDGGPLSVLLADGFHSVSPGNEDGTVQSDDSFKTEVTVEDDCAGVPPIPPLEGEACLSADYQVFCGPEAGTHNVVLSGATVAEDFVGVTVLTPGVSIDNGGILTDTVAVPVVAGTYIADLIITGAAPGSLVTFAISGDGDVGVIEELPGGFAVCCTTQVIVAIPETCEEAPEGPLPGPGPEDDPVEPEDPRDQAGDWDLEIEKRVINDPARCAPGERCDFEITVTNRGPEPQRGDIVLRDEIETPENGQLAGFVPAAPWDCRREGRGVACTYPNADLPVGGSVSLRIPALVAAQPEGGRLGNCATITEGDIEGPGRRWNRSCAFADIMINPDNQDPPRDDGGLDQPETDLGIRKSGPAECRAGETCTFEIEVTNEAATPYSGEIVISDVPSDGRVRYQGHSPRAWQCEAGSAAVICRLPDATLAPGGSTSLTLRMSVPNSASLARSDFENCGYLGGETGAGANARPDTRAVQQALTDLGYNPGPIDGAFGRRTAGALRDFQRDNGLNVTGTATAETLDALGLTAQSDEEPFRDAFADDNAFCIPVDVTRPAQVAPPPAPRPQPRPRPRPEPQPEQTTPTRPSGQVFSRGRCRNVTVQCPRGTRRVNGRCVPIIVNCPTGQIRVNGRCVPIILPCPSGQERVNGRCRPKQVQCPTGQKLIRGKCRPINNNQSGQTTRPGGQTTVPQPIRCKPGQVLVNGRCVRLQIQIPGAGTLRIQ
jgi:hypothetical protein